MKRVLNVILIVAIIFQFVPKETMAMSSVTGLEIVGGIDLYDENGMLLVDDYFRSNTIKASAVVKNSSTQECSVMLVIAYYEATLVDVKGQADFKNRGKSFVKNAFEICVIKIIFYYAYILLVYGLNFYGCFPKSILFRY